MAEALKLKLSTDQVTALMAVMPAAARQPGSGLAYADDVLTVPPSFAAAATAAMKKPGWDAPPLEAMRADARRAAAAYVDAITARITEKYTAVEVASWPTQEAEARAVVAGAKAQAAPLIAALAASAGQTIAAYSARVLEKSSEHRAVLVSIKSLRDTTEAALAAAKTETEISAAFEAAKTAAAQIAKA
jgi:hypothetical protein